MATATTEVFVDNVNTPMGLVSVGCTARGLRLSGFGPVRRIDRKGLRVVRKSTPLTRKAVRQLREYFAGRRRHFTLPLDVVGTPFQRQVWQKLKRVGYGKTVSYGELARRAGSPKAARAVGMACNRNPLGIVIPCHRVVGADGSLTGYASGLSHKRSLLQIEQN